PESDTALRHLHDCTICEKYSNAARRMLDDLLTALDAFAATALDRRGPYRAMTLSTALAWGRRRLSSARRTGRPSNYTTRASMRPSADASATASERDAAPSLPYTAWACVFTVLPETSRRSPISRNER